MNLAATMSLSAGAFLGPLSQVRGGLGSILGSIAALGGVSLSVAGAIKGIKDALDLGGRLSDLEARTGIAVQELVVLEQAFRNAGISADAVGPSINIMQRALAGISEAGEQTQAVFDRLGLDMVALGKDAPIDQLRQVAERIRALPSAAQQSAAAMKIFGRGGAEMLPLLKDARALADAAAMVGRQAEVLGRNAAQFDRASDILAAAPLKLRGFFVGAAESISASLLSSLEQVNDFDFTTLGQKFGAALAPYLEALKSGAIWQVIGLGLTQTLAVWAANLAQLLLVDLPTLFVSGLHAPIQWMMDRLKYGFVEAIQFFAAQWNKVAPKKFQISKESLPAQNEPRSLGQVFSETLTGLHPGWDWGRWVKEQFEPAMESLMKPFRAAAAKSRETAQGMSAAPTAPVKLGPESVGRMFDQNADRLARIGLFVGGSGGPALDYARRTARATEIMAGVMARNRSIDQGLADRQALWQ
jgi:hypothetical protein